MSGFSYGWELNLGEVFVNLLQNAIDAMEDGGVLTLLTSERDGQVEILLSDTGQGIPDEIRHKVVDAFFTTKDTARGTGLGLANCSRIFEEHGGDLTIDSEVGVGTTVRVVLPLVYPRRPVVADSVVV